MEVLKKIYGSIKKAFTSNKAKAFYWQTCNGFVLFIVAILSEMEKDGVSEETLVCILIGLAALNGITKYINKKLSKKNKNK